MPSAYGGLCGGNGNVLLPFGNAEYVGMGFFVFSLIIVFEIFGSPFVRNGAVFLALLFGYVFAVVVPSLQTGKSFVNQDIITAAPVGTFLWTTTFPLSEWLSARGAEVRVVFLAAHLNSARPDFVDLAA